MGCKLGLCPCSPVDSSPRMSHPSRASLVVLIAVMLVSCKSSQRTPSMTARELPAIPLPQKGGDEPPPSVREFRAAWVATVGNIDWPSKAGLSTQEQQREVIAMLDRARELNLNAIVLQVRTTAD